MPTLNLVVSASSDDAHSASNSTDTAGTGAIIAGGLTSTILSPGNHSGTDRYYAGCRFLSVTIPQGATISSATFTLTPQATYNAGANSITYLVRGQAADTTVTFGTTTNTNGLSTTARTRTTASTTWDQKNVTVDVGQALTVTTIVQEIINRAGWTSGNSLVIIIELSNCTTGEWQDYYSFDHASGQAPKLDITYSSGATYNLTASASSASTTPDTPALPVARTLAQAAASTSTTPDTPALPIARALAAAQASSSTTPDTAALLNLLSAALSVTSGSSTPDTSALPIARSLATAQSSSSITPDTIAILRQIASTLAIDSTSSTPDTVNLIAGTIYAFSLALASESITPDTVAVLVARALTHAVTSTTTTPDVIVLQRALGTALALTSGSSTPDTPALPIARGLELADASLSSTPDTAVLKAARALAVALSSASTVNDLALLNTGRVNYSISVGAGYTDVSPKQLIRTSGNRLYVLASNCESYPCDAVAQTLRMYRADQTGLQSSFTRTDSAHEPGGVAGWSMAIDGSNVIHVLYTIRTSNAGNITDLKYNTFDTSTDLWGTAATVDTTLAYGATQGDQSVAVAVDSSGVPHVVYLKSDGTRRRVTYRNRAGGSWSSATTVDDQSFGSNQKCWHPNLAFDSTGRLLVSWHKGAFNDDTDGVAYSRVRSSGGTFGTTATIASSLHVGIDQSSALLVTPNGRYHATFILPEQPTLANSYIRYYYSDDQGGSWTANHPTNQGTHNPALCYIAATDKLRIMGHGTPDGSNHGQNLYYFEGSGGSASWGSWTQFVTGSNFDSSVNTRWAQFFHAAPSTIDIAYWNDNYPNNLYVGTEIIAYDATLAAASISATPDTVALLTALLLTLSRSSGSTTPDTVALLAARALAMALSSTSSTPDTVALLRALAFALADASTSSTPDTAALVTGAILALTLSRSSDSTTPDTSALLAARALAIVLSSTSSAPDVVAILRTMAIFLSAGSTSTTPDAVALLRQLVAVLPILSLSSTSDGVGIPIARSLTLAAFSDSGTAAAALAIARALQLLLSSGSLTPSTANLVTALIEGLISVAYTTAQPSSAWTAAQPLIVFEE